MTHEELRYERLRQSFDAMQYKISDKEIDSISHDYIEFLPDNNQLFEGAVEVLDYLNPKYNLHIITNGFAEVQERKIKNSGLGNYFKTITNSEMAGVKKPHRTIFEFALTLAKVQKENAIMIGDCIDSDVRGAINFGMQAILFDEKKVHEVEEIKTINHLLELKKIL
jgi:putative hydrolase of the HAD superfamily